MQKNTKVVAIIPAKGNSKRLLNKNILEINGRPMLTWAIKACQDSKYNIEPWVSSESDIVLDIAKKFGAKTYKRDNKLSEPNIFKQEVIRDAALYITNSTKQKIDVFISLQPNSPQITAKHLDEGLDLLLNSYKGDSLYEVFSVDKDYFQNAAYRMFRSHYVMQRDLSTHCAVVVCDVMNIDTPEDYKMVRDKMSINHWEQALYKNKGETLEKNYLFNDIKLKNTNMLLDYIDSKVSLNKDSNVLELGCNLARNLMQAQYRYGCYVTGFDINKESIEKNKKSFKEKCNFHVADLRNHLILKSFEDKYFDVGITMGFLMHIPQSKSKDLLILEMLRICKRVCMFEMFDIKRKDILLENEWSLSFEDYRKYSKDIVLTDIVSNTDKHFTLFYYENVDKK